MKATKELTWEQYLVSKMKPEARWMLAVGFISNETPSVEVWLLWGKITRDSLVCQRIVSRQDLRDPEYPSVIVSGADLIVCQEMSGPEIEGLQKRIPPVLKAPPVPKHAAPPLDSEA